MIAKALRASGGSRLFPDEVGSKSCRIEPGGPPGPKPAIAGSCSTAVKFIPGHGGQALVTFEEQWPWSAFRYAGSPRRTQRHSWRYLVLATGKVVPDGESGDFPPQYMK